MPLAKSFRAPALLCCFALWSAVGAAQTGPYDPPSTYYNTATGTGATLKGQLHDIIDNHTVRSYGDARSILQVTDQDPNDPDRMLLVYNRASLDVSAINPTGSIPGWDSGVTWNREHTWPRSRGVDDSGPDNSDLHQLRPSNPSINTSRGNLNFGGEYGAQGYGSVSDGGTKWYPGDEDAGMIARQQFYMAVRYDGSDGSTTDLELSSGNPSSGLGDLDRLIEWHYAAPPDEFELRRNDVIYDSYQFNRNPFIDRPEYVWSVFVDQQNDTQLSLAGATVGADGGSSLSLDLGRAYVGQAADASTTVSLEKTGSAGTYFSATPAFGPVTTPATDTLNAFALGSVPAASIPLDLEVNTAVVGETTAVVVFDNLDVTTGGGLGVGAQDEVDTAVLSFSVVDHPVASFGDTAIESALTIDFGSVPLGGAPLSIGAELLNFNGAGAPTLAADLDLDSITGIGDTGLLTTDLVSFSGLSQGSALTFDATLDPSSAGILEAVYTLNLSGEDLPGEQTQQLTLTLQAEVVASMLVGDYNGNGTVDNADYTLWRDAFGSTVNLAADGNGNGVIDAGDFTLWRDNFGATAAGSTLGVPEPAAWLSLTLAAAITAGPRRRRSSSRCS